MEYTEELGNTICEHLADGTSLLETCRLLNLKESTVRKWAKIHEDFGANYARAREDGDDIEFERLWELASEHPAMNAKGVDSGWVQWQRNRIDTAKWMLARKRPKKFGDRTVVAGDPENPIDLVVHRVVADE